MNANQNVVDTLKNLYASFQAQKVNTETFKFTKDDISMNHEGILIDGTPINGKAQKTLLAKMKVRPEFIELADKATTDDWSVIVDNIKNELTDRPYYAKVRRSEDNHDEVYVILDYPIYEKIEPVQNDVFINLIVSGLENTSNRYKLFSADFDKENNSIIVGLINEDTKFNISGEYDGKVFELKDDVWMAGVQFTFTETMFSAKHLLERLICSNGMTTKEDCFTSNIAKKNFNLEKIEKAITHAFERPYDEMAKKISKQVALLSNTEISIKEFYEFSKPVLREAKKNEVLDEVEVIFDDSIFYKEYGLNVKEMSSKWQATAKTGINAYKFFSAMTYAATHIFNSVNPTISTDLQLKISNFFFKETFELDEIAPVVEFEYDTKHVAFI